MQNDPLNPQIQPLNTPIAQPPVHTPLHQPQPAPEPPVWHQHPSTPPPTPLPPTGQGGVNNPRNDMPIAVVQALSVRGVEYTMMTLSLWLMAGSIIWVLISLINGGSSFSALVLPTAVLIACVPVFGFLFLRLKKEELANPDLRFDPSKRRLSQFTQIVAFAAVLFNTIGFIYMVLQKAAGQSAPLIVKSFLTLLVVLLVAGGVLAYYWRDEHKIKGQ